MRSRIKINALVKSLITTRHQTVLYQNAPLCFYFDNVSNQSKASSNGLELFT